MITVPHQSVSVRLRNAQHLARTSSWNSSLGTRSTTHRPPRRLFATRLWALWVALLVLGWSGSAAAGPQVNIPRAEDGPGLKVGQRSTFHPGFALVAGVDTNVFNTASNEPRGGEVGPAVATFVLPTGWLGIGNRKFRDGLLMSPPQRTARKLDYYVGAIAGFRQYLARRPTVVGQSRISGGLQVRLAFLPGRRFSINFDEDLFRYAQPGNYEAQPQYNLNRVTHKAQLTLIGRPGGGRFSILTGLRNQVLAFENRAGDADLVEGNRTVNGFVTEGKWRFLPKSAIVLNYSMDWTFYFCCDETDRGRNEDNFAHRITAGYRGQILKRVVLDALAGYGLGYYRDDVNGPNFSSFIGELAVTYFPTPRTTVHGAVYRSFSDSLLGNYYVDVGARLQGRYEFKWRMISTVGVWVAGRRYAGLPLPGVENAAILPLEDGGYIGRGTDQLQRRDTLFNLNVKIEQPIKRIFSVGLQYDLAVDSTDFQTRFTDGGFDVAGFNRHVVMLMGAVRL